MLEYAKKYETEIKRLFIETVFDFHYKFAHLATFQEEFIIPDNTWAKHCFASVHDGKVIGIIEYYIHRQENFVSPLHIEHFGKEHNVQFGRDVIRCVKDIFEKFHFNKLNYFC